MFPFVSFFVNIGKIKQEKKKKRKLTHKKIFEKVSAVNVM